MPANFKSETFGTPGGGLEAAFNNLQIRAGKAANILARRAAMSHVEVSRELAPVGETGLLSSTIHVEPEFSGIVSSKPENIRVVAPQPYAGYVEYGTSDTMAQPFFVPGYVLAKLQMQKEAGVIIKRALAGKDIESLIGTMADVIGYSAHQHSSPIPKFKYKKPTTVVIKDKNVI